MTKPVRLVADAEADIAEAIDWYEHERPGLGGEFLDEVRAAIRTLGRPGPECRPVIGLPTSVGHLAELRRSLEKEPAKIILHTAYQSDRGARRLSQMSGLPVVELPYTVGGSKQAVDLFTLFDDTLQRLLEAVK